LSGSQSCFELLDDINQHREKLVLNIAQITQQYITPTHPDKAYRLMVRAQLYQEYQKRTKLIHHIYRHMENFEQGLFIKIKKLTLDRLANAQSRINQQRELLNKSAPT
jgi:Skp family chaperone for outer membrane proteins